MAPGPGIAVEAGPEPDVSRPEAEPAGGAPEAERPEPGGLPVAELAMDAPMAMDMPMAMDAPMAMDETEEAEDGGDGLPFLPMAAFDPDAPIG
ncbi:hypothetical protein HKCCE4037_19255, partial [Rhodobacterales bacterium HKCCE4037]|nr:hypothetical protein [Rhodobacterales bacterium HKCCE4037]